MNVENSGKKENAYTDGLLTDNINILKTSKIHLTKMEGLLKCGLYLQSGIYSEVAFNTVLTKIFQNPQTQSPLILQNPLF